MPTIPFADNFLAGSILTLLLPVGLLIAIAIWYVLGLTRVPGADPSQTAPLPTAPAPEGVPGEPPGSTT